MSLSHQTIALNSSTPTLISLANTDIPDFAREANITIQNLDTTSKVYIGSSSVTTSNFGIKLVPGDVISLTIPPSEKLYAVADASINVSILKIILS
jgi:hypothetical protein